MKYIDTFKLNLNFLNQKNNQEAQSTFFYKLENFDLFDTEEYEKFIIGFFELILEHSESNMFDRDLLADIVHMEYGVSRIYILEQSNIEFLYDDKKYSFLDFEDYLSNTKGMSFVDYGLFSFSFLIQQYCKRNKLNVNSINQYILNKHLIDLSTLFGTKN